MSYERVRGVGGTYFTRYDTNRDLWFMHYGDWL